MVESSVNGSVDICHKRSERTHVRPEHTRTDIPFRCCRVCCTEEKYENFKYKLKKMFHFRGEPRNLRRQEGRGAPTHAFANFSGEEIKIRKI